MNSEIITEDVIKIQEEVNNEHFDFVKISDGARVINQSKGTEYVITEGPNRTWCSCPDYIHRKFNTLQNCKHITAYNHWIKSLNGNGGNGKVNLSSFNPILASGKMPEGTPATVATEKSIIQAVTGFINHSFETFKKIAYRPFRPEQIRERKGPGGKVLSYVATADVITRLQELFSFKWDFEILSETIEKGEVFCKVRITAEIDGKTVRKEAYGGQIRELKKDGSYVNNIADDLKCATSDALKKAATLFSVGNHLYK